VVVVADVATAAEIAEATAIAMVTVAEMLNMRLHIENLEIIV